MAFPFLASNSARTVLFVNCYDPVADFTIRFHDASGDRVAFRTRDVAPTDTRFNLGNSGSRWNNVYTVSGIIQTSDERNKQDLRDISVIEKDVAQKIKGIIKAYRFKHAVKIKGNKARTHIGVIAQEVEKTFSDAGLDAFEYGILCFDEWDEDVDDEGHIIAEAGDRYSIRYDELCMFILASL
ncbi:hypothetical protein GZ77_03935 [Endozoicomonas montiporae]|uniref:Peptidase S74 domain-containing protein n=2 Tax=Endozoicomonas montiporae TaxID=1027273 RepID=A0A081NB96_9GAMM|nr:tail fiber domain-containing protein [Endozoicomonas montiporae]AMO56549.1 hypothetical protein EZMO1_2465 [Endozoicomonas montiporae CL-33]KEQ15719.1 hypothetical protein GZ77_03935 [Endozoicomonas montiporae]